METQNDITRLRIAAAILLCFWVLGAYAARTVHACSHAAVHEALFNAVIYRQNDFPIPTYCSTVPATRLGTRMTALETYCGDG